MNKDQYRPRFMNMWDSDTFSKVYATFESLKEKINNTEGNSPAEKFFNMVLGSDNEISKKTDNSIVPTYRFTKDGIKNKDGKLENIEEVVAQRLEEVRAEMFQKALDNRTSKTYECTTIDEIKTSLANVEHLTQPVPEHLAQAKCYAAIYGEQEALETIGVQMTYATIEKEKLQLKVKD